MLLNEEVQSKFEELNDKLDDAVSIMNTDDKVIGRDQELVDLAIGTERLETPTPLLYGGAGTGKTALVCSYMNILKEAGKDVFPFEVDIGAMAENQDKLKVKIANLLKYAKELRDAILKYKPNAKVYLFIDEIHEVVSIFPRGTKIGGDLLKKTLSRAEDFCIVIGATTVGEYSKHIATDEALKRRFKPILLKEVDDNTTRQILRGMLDKYTTKENHLSEKVSDEVLDQIIEYNKQYRSDMNEPAKSKDALLSIESASRVLNRPIDSNLVKARFEREYGVDLTFNVDIEHCMSVIKRRIKGQPIAIDAMKSVILEIKVNAAKKEMKPRYVGLFVGSTGVGKTEMAKSVAEGIFGSEKHLIKMDMANYSDELSGDRFRRDLGLAAKADPSSVVLFDEIEKAHDNVLNILLAVTGEGEISYEIAGAEGDMEPQETNLRNTIMFGTSNAGSDIFQTLKKRAQTIFEGNVMTDEYQIAQREVSSRINETLRESDLKPEFLNRVEGVIPFLGLSQATLLEIASDNIDKSMAELEELTNISVEYPTFTTAEYAGITTGIEYNPLALYIVIELMQKNNTDQNGARYVKSLIRSNIRALINRAIYDYGDQYSAFRFTTNGECRWENPKSARKVGLIRIEPTKRIIHKKTS